MLSSVRWWVTQGGENPSRLFCLHNISLDAYCQKCAEHDG